MDLRELLIILLVAAAGCVFVWFERGRDPAILTAGLIMLGVFAVIGAGAVAVF